MVLLAEAGFGKTAYIAQLVNETMKGRVITNHSAQTRTRTP